MSLIDYNDIVGDNQFSKSDVQKIVDGSNDNHNRISYLETVDGRDVTKFFYGANLRNFIKKAREWRAGRKFATPPKVVIIGDSITGGEWAELIKQHLVDTFYVPSDNIDIHWYGGYSIKSFYPFIDTVLIEANPDLVIFNENEGAQPSGETSDSYLNMIETIFYKLRKYTTSDIMIGTWSMDGDAVQGYYDTGVLPSHDNYEFFNWYRDTANKYNCELVDFNQALLDYADAGNNPSGHYDGVHWDSTWYTNVFYSEIVKHFNEFNWQSAINQPNHLSYKFEYISLIGENTWSKFNDSNVSIHSSFLRSSQRGALRATSITESIIINAKNIIGFEIFTDDTYSSAKSYKIEIDDGSGYKAPSAMTPFGEFMEYATEIQSVTYADNWDSWRLKRPKKITKLTTALGYDNRATPKRYTMIVTSVTGSVGASQTVTVDIKNDIGTIIGTFTSSFADWVVSGMTFYQYWNDEYNHARVAADATFPASSSANHVVGDEWEFYLKSNWIDQPNTADGDAAFIFGLEPGDYDIKITAIDSGVDFVGLKLYKS